MHMRKVSRGELAAILLGVTAVLAGCGGGGGSSPPPAASPPPPPPSGGTVVPPISSTVQDITDGHKIGATHSEWTDPQTAGQDIDGFKCILTPSHQFARYAHVSIIQNGEALAVPGNIGASPQGNTHCFYELHTHNQSGKVHVTPDPTDGTFTLGQFFKIWQQPLSETNVAGISGLPVKIFITDGTTTTEVAAADWSNIELKDHREVTISLGTEVTEIPNFTWTGND
jgi:hypothetical protein